MFSLNIKDPLHGTIELNELESRIIDTKDFQRLRRIKQLATTYLVYPGANHSRFEHSLGTLHLASCIAEKLGFENETKQKIRLYALLHDLGHVAFSHETERAIEEILGNHEKIGRKKILRGEIGDIVSENFNKREIADFDSSPYAKIISSDLGADRMDYLKRDAYYTGVAYGIIDEERIINKMYFEQGELGVGEGALESSESLLIARFMMFSTVYLHHTVRIASAMLERAIRNALRELKAKQFLDIGDAEAFALLSKKKNANFYINALINRNLYKEAYSINSQQFNKTKIQKMEKEISLLTKCEIIIDSAPNFFKLSGFKIKMHNGKKCEISHVSELVKALKLAEESRKKILVLTPAAQRKKVEKACLDYFS